MKNQQRKLLFVAAISGFLCVAFGAFGSHALKEILSEPGRHQYDIGVRYAFFHTFAVFMAAMAIPLSNKPEKLNLAAWFFIAGVILFSGSLIALALSGIHFFAMITPLGGLSFLLGWGFFAYSILGGNND